LASGKAALSLKIKWLAWNKTTTVFFHIYGASKPLNEMDFFCLKNS